jgi:serine/threonine protein kinase/Flp pilus assembly protein TadD
MLDCHRRLIDIDCERPTYPEVGERINDFRLLEELFRGSRGRVYIAAQAALADRVVVLKVTPLDGAEHLSLARLQHTNIVPLYSAADDPVRKVRILCMPYFGRATLASLLDSLADVPPAARTGRDVVAVVDRLQRPAERKTTPQLPAAGAARRMLDGLSYVQAMARIAACLAEALQFAHERGLVHLDLKPHNVLLAADGQPMLLDFHLARGPVRPEDRVPDRIGGTPQYMPPEQRAAMHALREGLPLEVALDGRADVYALGAIFYEMLGGRLPHTANSLPLEHLNSEVGAGLSDIIAKCLARRPHDRYPDAAALAEDLRRHLADEPLEGVANRSLSERWRKWRRRRPGTFRIAAALLVVLGAAGILAAAAVSNWRERGRQADAALFDGETQLRASHYADAVRSLNRGLRLASRVPFNEELKRRMRERVEVATNAQIAEQLHRLADQVRVLYCAQDLPASRARAIASQCKAVWAKRNVLLGGSDDGHVGTGVGSALVPADLRDVALFYCYASRDADAAGALRILDEVEAAFGPSPVLAQERRRCNSGGAGDVASPETGTEKAARTPPRTGWEHYAIGRSSLAAGDLPGALRELATALELEPADRWTNFYYGLCVYRLGRYEDAAAAFGVCIGAAPDVAASYYNRALAYVALGRTDRAVNDYDRTLQLDPTHPGALLNRGMLRYQQGRLAEALADVRAASSFGADEAAVRHDLALIQAAAEHAPAAPDVGEFAPE